MSPLGTRPQAYSAAARRLGDITAKCSKHSLAAWGRSGVLISLHHFHKIVLRLMWPLKGPRSVRHPGDAGDTPPVSRRADLPSRPATDAATRTLRTCYSAATRHAVQAGGQPTIYAGLCSCRQQGRCRLGPRSGKARGHRAVQHAGRTSWGDLGPCTECTQTCTECSQTCGADTPQRGGGPRPRGIAEGKRWASRKETSGSCGSWGPARASGTKRLR